MIVEQILNDKGREVVTLRAGISLKDAAILMDERKIGAVVALDEDDRIVGVLSERDIVRQVARHGASALEMPVGSAMTRAVVTVYAETAIDEALQTMTDRRIRHLPVLRDGRLAGVISIGDVVKCQIAEATQEAESLRTYISAG